MALIAFLIWLGSPLSALNPETPVDSFLLDQWQTAREKISNTVISLAQTPDGFLWIGGYAGLARFDGMRFSLVPLVQKETNDSLEIRSLWLDKKETLWIGTSRGLISYDCRSGRFKTFNSTDGITADSIRRLAGDTQGNLWIGFAAGYVNKYINGKFTAFGPGQGLEGNKINAVIEEPNGDLVFGTRENGVFKYRGGEFSRYAVQGLDNLLLKTMYPDSWGNLWIGTDNGLLRVTGKRTIKYTIADGLSNNDITAIMEDSDRNLWVGAMAGLNRVKIKPDGNIVFETLLENLKIFCLFEDREKSLWLGTYDGGIARLKERRFGTCRLLDPYRSEILFSLFADRQGAVWIGTVSGKLLRCRGNEIKDCTPAPGIFSPGVSAMAEDASGNLWIGTNGKGVFKTKEKGFVRYGVREGLCDNQVTSILPDSRGNLWIGTFAGVGILDTSSGKIESFTTREGLSGGRVHNIYEDSARNIWIAADKGITVLKGGKMEKQNLSYYLPGIPVTCIYEDRSAADTEGGVFWIATDGFGLKRLRAIDGEIVSYTHNDGMSADSIYQFFEDAQDHFWLMSKSSLLRVDKSELNRFAYNAAAKINCRSFDLSDSLESTEFNNEFSRNSVAKTSSGEYWFITRKGISILNPEKFRLNLIPPPVVFDTLLFGRRTVSSLPGQNVPYTFIGVKDFSAWFTAPSFLSPEKIRFEYRLDGVDTDWITLPVGRERLAVYRSLKPGDYKFTVRACNADGEWNYTGAAVAFTLKPFFYETLVFKIGLLSIVIAGPALLVYMRWKRASRGKQREEETAKDEEKDAINDEREDKPPLDPIFVNEIVGRLERLMKEEKIYCDKNISVQALADKLGIQRYLLSRVLNERIKQSFPDYINSQRIEEAKRLLASPKSKDIKVTALASDIGFFSITAFHKAFKRYSGLTPYQYKKQARTFKKSS